MGLNLILIYKCCVYAQTPLDAWPGLETQACYNAPGDLLDLNFKNKANNVRLEANSSIMTQSLL